VDDVPAPASLNPGSSTQAQNVRSRSWRDTAAAVGSVPGDGDGAEEVPCVADGDAAWRCEGGETEPVAPPRGEVPSARAVEREQLPAEELIAGQEPLGVRRPSLRLIVPSRQRSSAAFSASGCCG
jgi:hypothetical protein